MPRRLIIIIELLHQQPNNNNLNNNNNNNKALAGDDAVDDANPSQEEYRTTKILVTPLHPRNPATSASPRVTSVASTAHNSTTLRSASLGHFYRWQNLTYTVSKNVDSIGQPCHVIADSSIGSARRHQYRL